MHELPRRSAEFAGLASPLRRKPHQSPSPAPSQTTGWLWWPGAACRGHALLSRLPAGRSAPLCCARRAAGPAAASSGAAGPIPERHNGAVTRPICVPGRHCQEAMHLGDWTLDPDTRMEPVLKYTFRLLASGDQPGIPPR